MDKLRAMSVFVHIVELGSLTAAADALDKSLPAIVRTLSALEDALGVRLLNRTTRRIALTEEGRFYLVHCKKLLAEVQETEEQLKREQTEPCGRLTLTAPIRFGEMHVAPLINEFLARYPRMRINLLLLDRVVDLIEEGIDLAVRLAHLDDSSLVARPLGNVGQVICASPTLLAEHGIPEHPKELRQLPCIRFSGISPTGGWHFRENGKGLNVSIDERLSCNQIAAAVEACRAGVGFGAFLDYQVMPWVCRGELAIVLADYAPPAVPVSLVYPHHRLLSNRVRVCVDWLSRRLPRTLPH